jgi:hypothetical protein
MREANDLFWERNRQIDPSRAVNNKIISYYRLLAQPDYGQLYTNFARFNPDFDFLAGYSAG